MSVISVRSAPIAALCAAWSFALATPLHAQLDPKVSMQRRVPSSLDATADGARVAFVVNEPAKGSAHPRHVWVLDSHTRSARQYTSSEKSEWSPQWSPDGRTLAFLSNREDHVGIFLLTTDGGEAQRLTDDKLDIGGYEWSPDGSRILFTAAEPKSDAQEKREKAKEDMRVVDKDDRPARLWVIEVASKASKQLVHGVWEVRDAHWLGGSDRIVVMATDHPESDQNTERLFAIGRTDTVLAPLGNVPRPFGDMQPSPDGKLIAFSGPRVDGPVPHDLFLMKSTGDSMRNVTAQTVDRPVSSLRWLADGSLLMMVGDGFFTRGYTVTAAGTATPMPASPSNIDDIVPIGAGAFATIVETAVTAPEVALWHPGGAPEVVTTLNASWPGVALVKPEIVKYKSFDGREIEAQLFAPAGGAKRLPTVVLVHGGPTGAYTDRFYAWAQLLATRGYVVLCPNVRGSSGYGFAFLASNRADWGGGDFKDVMAGADYLVARGIADPDKLGIGGWSYGGYMAMWAVTQTNRFKASVAGAGLSDLAAEYGTEAGPSYDEWFYGLPYEKPEGFAKSSPLTYVKHARTPTLILQGEEDQTDPIGQSTAFYRALKRYGAPSDLVLYPREGHGIREEAHALDVLQRMVGWFDRYLRGVNVAGK